LSAQKWVHVFEEDTPEGAVYRPENEDVPLSRRPRERLELLADGSAKVLVPGPDDRLLERAATWSEEGGQLVIRTAASGKAAPAGKEYRVIERSADRLVIRQ
jgi:hypothetical protein